MSTFNCDSYCGIYCGACDIMVAEKTGVQSKFAAFWYKFVTRALPGISRNGTTYVMRCHGCKSDILFENCAGCRIRACAIGKNMGHCIECSDYPCALIAGMKKIEKVLPHIQDNKRGLDQIRREGLDRWLAVQEKRWRCPGCGTGFSWYMERCPQCGMNLSGRSFRFSYWRSVLLKIGIFLSARKGR